MASFTGNAITVKGSVPVINGSIRQSAQGPVAQMAFAAGTPAGFRQAMTFNMLIDGGINYNVRTGRLVITLKPEAVKTGRIFGLVGLDKSGQPHVFADVDRADNTITCDISLAGYAFSLIYSDGINTAGSLTANSAAGVYVVRPRDTLSKIARRLGTTVSALVKKNSIKNPNRIYPNQVIRY
ncbi:MAG: LysM peptidoglycan-binding domain-containing protein [Lachnospiraceae bacterium]|nr:LysM peptidoglycan-binding domain-containing protein [Lachnospiraceae bacterium]